MFIPLLIKNEVVQVAPPQLMKEDSMDRNRNEIDQVVKMAILDSNLTVLALYILDMLTMRARQLVQNSYFSFHDVLDTKRVAQSLSGDLYCLGVFCLMVELIFFFPFCCLYLCQKLASFEKLRKCFLK